MNRLGIMVDLSHANEKSFFDAAAISDMPLILSLHQQEQYAITRVMATYKQLRLVSRNGRSLPKYVYILRFLQEQTKQRAKCVNHIDYITNLIALFFRYWF